jgi:hypothetical protein
MASNVIPPLFELNSLFDDALLRAEADFVDRFDKMLGIGAKGTLLVTLLGSLTLDQRLLFCEVYLHVVLVCRCCLKQLID